MSRSLHFHEPTVAESRQLLHWLETLTDSIVRQRIEVILMLCIMPIATEVAQLFNLHLNTVLYICALLQSATFALDHGTASRWFPAADRPTTRVTDCRFRPTDADGAGSHLRHLVFGTFAMVHYQET